MVHIGLYPTNAYNHVVLDPDVAPKREHTL